MLAGANPGHLGSAEKLMNDTGLTGCLFTGSSWIPDCFEVRRQSGAVDRTPVACVTTSSCRGPGCRFQPHRGDGALPWPQRRCSRRMRGPIQSGGRQVAPGQPGAQVEHCSFRVVPG